LIIADLLISPGGRAFRDAVLQDRIDEVRDQLIILLRYGANPNIKDTAGRTALHLIAARGVGKVAIRALVEAGADLNVRDREGMTPLAFARPAERQSAMKELIALGAKN
jgi:ankyrin repeat protein